MRIRSGLAGLLAPIGVGALIAAGAVALPAQAASGAPSSTEVLAPQASEVVPGRYIVVLRDTVASTAVRSVAASHASTYGVSADQVYSSALKGYAAAMTPATVAALRKDPRVEYVTEDRAVHMVGTTPVATGETVPPGIRRIGAATTSRVHQRSTVNVAVIDTGIDLTHPDLNAENGTNCIRPNRSANDDHGHGSNVAGIIAARNNGAGVVGVAPGTRVYAVKVLNAEGDGTDAQVLCGIDWVTANAKKLDIKVANMSLGGVGANDNNCGRTNLDPMHRAICRSTDAGVTYVVAAGNEGADLATSVPASYPEALTVSAMADTDGVKGAAGPVPACFPSESDDRFASFSNFATTTRDANHTIAGPGVCVFSTSRDGGYTTFSGTSQATPHVAGSVALCLGNGGSDGPCNRLSPARIVQKLRANAQEHATASNGFTGDPQHPVPGKYFGYVVWSGEY